MIDRRESFERQDDKTYKLFKKNRITIKQACDHLGEDRVYQKFQRDYNKADTPLKKMTVYSYFKSIVLRLFSQVNLDIEEEEEYED